MHQWFSVCFYQSPCLQEKLRHTFHAVSLQYDSINNHAWRYTLQTCFVLRFCRFLLMGNFDLCVCDTTEQLMSLWNVFTCLWIYKSYKAMNKLCYKLIICYVFPLAHTPQWTTIHEWLDYAEIIIFAFKLIYLIYPYEHTDYTIVSCLSPRQDLIGITFADRWYRTLLSTMSNPCSY